MQPDATPRFGGVSKRIALLIATSLTACIFAAVWLVCSMEYNNKKKDVLYAQKESMDIWVSGTVNAAGLWLDGLESQAKRVSSSELYRLFASEVTMMDIKTQSLVNEADSGVALPDSIANLAEEVPMIRNLLFDFMTYSGLMDARIVGNEGQTLLSAMPRPSPVTPEQMMVAQKAIKEKRVAYSAVRSSPSGLVIDIADPLLATMTSEGVGEPVGALVLTAPVTGQIAQFLTRDLRQAGLKSSFLQYHSDAWQDVRVAEPAPAALTKPVTDSLQVQNNSLPFALRPGLGGGEAYSLGARIVGTDWWIVLEIPATVVDEELSAQKRQIYGMGGLVGLGSVLLLSLLWWVMVGRQQQAIAERFQHLYLLIQRQKLLLDSVNVSLDVGLFMADVKGDIQLGNRAFAEIARADEASLTNSTLAELFDGRAAGRLLDWIRSVADSDNSSTYELELPQADGEHLYRVTLFPFDEAAPKDAHKARGAVGIMQDITEFRRSSEKRRRQQVHTMQAFVRAIEGVDPYLAGHSRKMAELGALMASRMGLSDADRTTIIQAAELSQVGKLFVPRELLAKTGKLTEEELKEMSKVPEHAYRVLKDIDFDLPVPQAVHEMYEHMDGTGYPDALSGDAISIHARVLAVVNAFSAMVSPRSYRAGMAFDEAIMHLHENTASYDQQVVDLLAEVVHTPEGVAAATAVMPEE